MADRGFPPVLADWVKRNGKKLALLGVVVCLLVAGVVVLLYVLASDGKEVDGGGPLELVRRFMEAVEREDIEAFMSCFCEEFPIPEPEPGFEPLLEGTEIDARKFLEFSFQDVDFRFEGVELELRSLKEDSATVITTCGRLSMNPLGTELERDLAREPLVFRMVRRNGRWYLTENPVPYIT